MSKRLLILIVIIVIAFILFFSCLDVFAQKDVKVSEKLWIAFPKNLAVFHILVILTPSGEGMMERFRHPLVNQARDYFRDYKDHPAVMMTDQLFQKMWYFVFNYLALYYSEFPEARLEAVIPAEYQEWRHMEKMIEGYLTSVRDFYLKSGFEEFWKAHSQDTQAIIEEVKDKLPAIDIPQLLEDFYGRTVKRYYFVPCPFMARSATHVEVQDKDGEWKFYHLDGGLGSENSFACAYFAFHEFSHCFIEPISMKYGEQIMKLAYLYKPLKKDFERMGYRDWDRAFAEHMVTAGQLHLFRKAFGEQKAMEMLQKEVQKGFRLIKHFYAYFEEYDKNRQIYPDLNAFYPQIFSRLSRFRVEEYRRPGILGFYYEFKGNKCLIKDVVPDSAFQKAGVEKGDILFSVEDREISSKQDFDEAMKRKEEVEEGDTLEVVVLRDGQKLNMSIAVPFVTDYRYVEEK